MKLLGSKPVAGSSLNSALECNRFMLNGPILWREDKWFWRSGLFCGCALYSSFLWYMLFIPLIGSTEKRHHNTLLSKEVYFHGHRRCVSNRWVPYHNLQQRIPYFCTYVSWRHQQNCSPMVLLDHHTGRMKDESPLFGILVVSKTLLFFSTFH